MDRVLKAVVKDHRLPSDYNYHYTQPMHSRSFLKNLKRFFITRQLTKQNITIPMYVLFGFLPMYMFSHITYNYLATGSLPQMIQSQNWLYRKGNYGVQHTANANPDNKWDKRFYCWTSDPSCGLDIAPKRPWLDLHDPTILSKHHREMDHNAVSKRIGFHGL